MMTHNRPEEQRQMTRLVELQWKDGKCEEDRDGPESRC